MTTEPTRTSAPVEWIALTFPGPFLNPAVVEPLAELVRSGTVRLIDAAVVHKDAEGQVTATEVQDEEGVSFDVVDGDVLELLSDDDLVGVAAGIERDTTTLVLVWESVWAAALAGAVERAGGTVLAHDRIPRADVGRALASAAARPAVDA